MSSNTDSASASSVPLGSRVNIYDSQNEEFDLDRDPGDPTKHCHDPTPDEADHDYPSVSELLDQDRGNHDYVQGVNREAWVAGSILRSYDNPPLYCPECWYRFETETELSDPEDHMPLVEVDHDFEKDDPLETSVEVSKHDHRKHRHCPECGCISFGGVLGDRDTETYLDIVRWFLDEADVIRESRREEILEATRRRKSIWGQSDDANMERIVREIRFGLEPESPGSA